MLAPPRDPHSGGDGLELLIREARERQRKRRLGATALVTMLAGAILAICAIAAPTAPKRLSSAGGASPTVKTGEACGIRVVGERILNRDGRTLFREPGHWTPGYPSSGVARCSGSAIWVVWDNGAAANQMAYVGARSADGGRSWKTVFAERFFGVEAPHELDAYLGAWTLDGSRRAYFTGTCPACSWGTVSLWTTRDAGATFQEYKIPGLTGYVPTGIRLSGKVAVTISAKRFTTRAALPRKTVTIKVS
jgi:hypothetical protein